jgi:glycosyltransferase involved in cell wall biosynthesis
LKISVLQLISSSGLYGAESMLLSLSKTLARLGCEMVVGAFKDKRDPHLELLDCAEAAGLAAIRIPCSARLDLNCVGAIRRAIGRLNARLIHTHGYKADLYGRAAALGGQTGLVSTCHNWPNPLRRMQIYAKLDRLALRTFDHVTTPSSVIAAALTNAGVAQDRISVISNGVDLDAFTGAEPKLRTESGWADDPVIGFAGRHVIEKGGEFLIRAAEMVLKNHPRCRFVFVGDGPARQEWQALAASLGIEKSVTFAGTRSDMPAVYASLDIAVLPSLNEAMPMTLLEAMASGCAVIGTRVGAVQELIDNSATGVVVDPANIEALVDAMDRLLCEADLRRQMGARARANIAAQHSADAMGRKYLRIYDRVLAGKSALGRERKASLAR